MAGASTPIRRLPLRAQGALYRSLFSQTDSGSQALSWPQSSPHSVPAPDPHTPSHTILQSANHAASPPAPRTTPFSSDALGPNSGALGPNSVTPGPNSGALGPCSGALGASSGALGPSSGAVSPLPGLWRGRLATPSERGEAGDQAPLGADGAVPLLSHTHIHSHSHSHSPQLCTHPSLQPGGRHVSLPAVGPAPSLALRGRTVALPWACCAPARACAPPQQGMRGMATGAGEGGEGPTEDAPAAQEADAVAAGGEGSGDDEAEVAAEAGPRERLRRREKFGTYGDDIEEELYEGGVEVLGEDGKPYFKHLYNARKTIDEWLTDPTFWGMLAAPPAEGQSDPLYEAAERQFEEESGPELRWETRLVLGPGGNAFHPANRKVKVAVFVKELGLTPLARERLLALVGRRYNPNRDELTIISERYDQREENRKDVLRILLALIDEARRADELAAAAE